MATESVRTEHLALPLDLVNEGDRLITQADAVLECLFEAAHGGMDNPKLVINGVTWMLRDYLQRLQAIINTKAGG